MNFRKITIVVPVIMVMFLPMAVLAQSTHRSLREGDELYDKSRYSDAEKPYADALKKLKANDKASYNLGNTYYRKGDYPNAAKMLGNAAQAAKTPNDRADAFHNLGNAFLKLEKYKEAVDAYQNSLINRPGDPETKQNLQMAKQRLQQQEQQQEQQQQKNQNQQNQEEQKQNNQPQDPQQKPEQQNPEQKQPEKQQQENQEPEIPKLEQPSGQFLEAIGREDQRNKRKYQEKTNNSKPGTKRKDW